FASDTAMRSAARRLDSDAPRARAWLRSLVTGAIISAIGVGIVQMTVCAWWDEKSLALMGVVAGLLVVIAVLGVGLGIELRRSEHAARLARDGARRYRLLSEHSADMIVSFDPHTQQRSYVSP